MTSQPSVHEWSSVDDEFLDDLLELRRLWAAGERTLLELGLTADELEVLAPA